MSITNYHLSFNYKSSKSNYGLNHSIELTWTFPRVEMFKVAIEGFKISRIYLKLKGKHS